MSDDNWVHRSSKMLCSSCMYYVPKISNASSTEPAPVTIAVGRCRRRAPTISGWPVMFPTDWCGDHKLDENK